LAAALASFQAELAIFDRLAKSDPSNTEWQRGLAIAYEKVGEVQKELGSLSAAQACRAPRRSRPR
jgi:hypothetical protein